MCLEGGRGIVCEPKECRQEPLECTEDGTYPLTEVNPADPCCNITSCSKAAPGQGLGWHWGAPGSERAWGPGRQGGCRPQALPDLLGLLPPSRVQHQPVPGDAAQVPTGIRSEERDQTREVLPVLLLW